MCTLSGVRQAGKTATGMSSIVRAAWKEYHNTCVRAKKTTWSSPRSTGVNPAAVTRLDTLSRDAFVSPAIGTWHDHRSNHDHLENHDHDHYHNHHAIKE